VNVWRCRWIYLLVLVLFIGCASGKEAREVARVTLTQITTYEELVDIKIGGEQIFYHNSLANLENSLKWGSKNEEKLRVTRAVNAFQSSTANAKQDLQAKDLRDYVTALLEDLRQSRTLYAEAKAKYNQDLLNSLAKLELQRQSLNKVKDGLEKLQVKSVDPDLILAWFAVGQEMEKNLGKKPLSSPATK